MQGRFGRNGAGTFRHESPLGRESIRFCAFLQKSAYRNILIFCSTNGTLSAAQDKIFFFSSVSHETEPFSCRFLICVSNGFRICNRNLKFGYLSFFRFLRFRYQENAKVRQFCIEKHSRMVYNRCCSKCVYRCLKRMHIHHIHFEFGQRADTGFLTERPVSLTECFATF